MRMSSLFLTPVPDSLSGEEFPNDPRRARSDC